MTSSTGSKSSSNKLDRLNHTELYQTCLNAGFKVHPGSPRDFFIGVLLGDISAPPMAEEMHPIDAWRIGIIGFLHDHWAVLEPQIKCPAKNLKHPQHPDPRPCFGCLDSQVMTCMIQNEGRVELLIGAKRPKGKQ
jgi:hypothetical protein